MHSVWDSVIYEYTDGPRPPLSSDQFDWFTTEAQKLSDKFPIDEKTILDGQFSTWSKENEKIAEETVYPGFSDPVTDEYKEKAIPILEERMMLGGRRLYQIIVDIYGKSAEISPEMFLQ